MIHQQPFVAGATTWFCVVYSCAHLRSPSWLAGALLSTVLLATAPAAEPSRIDLFAAGERGYASYRIPGIVVTKRGTLLAYGEARKGDSDWTDERLVLRRSTDGGKTWSDQREVFVLPEPQPLNPLRIELRGELGDAQTNSRAYHNLVMIPDHGQGTVHAVFCLDYWRVFYSRSDDDGLTFAQPREITTTVAQYRAKGWNWRAVGNGCGHGLRLDNGRLLVPLWLSASTQPRGHGHRPSHVGVLYSDDAGSSWQIGDWAAKHSPPELVSPSETCAVQLSDGNVLFNIRHETPNHRRAVAISADGVNGWSKPRSDEALFEPVCEASMVRIPGSQTGRGAILFCNPDSKPADPASTELSRRRNLTLKMSFDDAKTWPVRKVLEPGPSGYSDLAVSSNHTIYCFFERGIVRVGNRNRTAALTLATFDAKWVGGASFE